MSKQSVVTICLPPGVWDRVRARLGAGKSNSEMGRQIVIEWLETLPGALKYQKPDEPALEQQVEILPDFQRLEVASAEKLMRYPVVLKLERPE